MPQQDVKIPTEAMAAARRGNVIEAIKITREKTGIGLKEAKDAVDSELGRTGPAGRRPVRDESRDHAGDYIKRPIVFVLLGVLVAVIAYLLTR